MKRSFISGSAAFFGILGLSAAAHAEAPVVAPPVSAPSPPAACSDRIDARQFSTGFSIGARTVQSAVLRVDDCDQIDRVTDTIINTVDRLTPPPGASSRITCRFAGILEGVLAELENQNFACEETCTADGSDFGLLSGQLYCELSILIGGLVDPNAQVRGPVNTCGLFFEFSCDTAYIDTTLDFPGCQLFTENEFVSVWDGSRAISCAYNLEEGPQLNNDE